MSSACYCILATAASKVKLVAVDTSYECHGIGYLCLVWRLEV